LSSKTRAKGRRGEGEGKSITAFGLALRAVGHGYKVIIIQFMKGRKDIGEFKIRKRLSPEYEIYQFGRKEFVDLKKPEPVDYELAEKGLAFARKALVGIGLLKLEDVIEFLEDIPESTVVVLTGRKAPKELIDHADLVTEMREIKHPMKRGVSARRGIEY